MDKQIVNMLSDIQQNMKEFDRNMKKIDGNMKEFGNDLKEIKETVNRIETSQTGDIVAMLKVGNQRSETDFHYLNTRITDIDKRVFTLENRAER
jgi:polyhydroxyalkanoate synthesis regulator phasin